LTSSSSKKSEPVRLARDPVALRGLDVLAVAGRDVPDVRPEAEDRRAQLRVHQPPISSANVGFSRIGVEVAAAAADLQLRSSPVVTPRSRPHRHAASRTVVIVGR